METYKNHNQPKDLFRFVLTLHSTVRYFISNDLKGKRFYIKHEIFVSHFEKDAVSTMKLITVPGNYGPDHEEINSDQVYPIILKCGKETALYKLSRNKYWGVGGVVAKIMQMIW